jgi:hypothetical protein
MRRIFIVTLLLVLVIVWLHQQQAKHFSMYTYLNSIGSGIGERKLFTDDYHARIANDWSCFGRENEFFIGSDTNRINDDRQKIELLEKAISEFTLLNSHFNRVNDSVFLTITLLNKRPIDLNFHIVFDQGKSVIHNIGNICELFEYIKVYKNKPKEEKTCIQDLQ